MTTIHSTRVLSRVIAGLAIGLLITLTAVPATAQGGRGAQGARGPWPPEIKNLQVFPADTPLGELIDKMKGFTSALGVRCQYCHVGEEGQHLSTFDFASDEKGHKQTTRVMLRMVEAINNDHLAELEGDEAPLRVECVTCHRGTSHPEQLDDLIVRVVTSEGADTATARYRELRERYYGGQSYDFGEQSLVRAAGTLAADQQVDAALSLLQLNLEHFPDSTTTWGALAQARRLQGDIPAAIAALRKVLAFDPENGRARAMLEELEKVQETTKMEAGENEAGEPRE